MDEIIVVEKDQKEKPKWVKPELKKLDINETAHKDPFDPLRIPS